MLFSCYYHNHRCFVFFRSHHFFLFVSLFALLFDHIGIFLKSYFYLYLMNPSYYLILLQIFFLQEIIYVIVFLNLLNLLYLDNSFVLMIQMPFLELYLSILKSLYTALSSIFEYHLILCNYESFLFLNFLKNYLNRL